MQEGDKKHNWFLILISLSCLAVIFSAFYFFYFKKNYDFVVEVSCDITQETCFQRDCNNPDDCPMNELSSFKRYHIRAADFPACKNEDCTLACESRVINCEPEVCVDNIETGDYCSVSSQANLVVPEQEVINE